MRSAPLRAPSSNEFGFTLASKQRSTAFLTEEKDGIEGGVTYHGGRINRFAERKMLAQEQMGRNRKINLGKNLESEEKPSITSLLTSESSTGERGTNWSQR